MVRVIIPGAMRQHDVGVPAADAAHDVLPGVQGRQQAAVVVTEDFGFVDAQPPRGFLCFAASDRGELRCWKEVMPGRAIGHREEFHGVASCGKLTGRAAELDLTIVGVRPDTDDPHRMNPAADHSRCPVHNGCGPVTRRSLPDRTFLFSATCFQTWGTC
jgi:hypothetical protein